MGVIEFLPEHQANIFDEVHGELDQRVFKGTTPRPLIVSFIQRKIFACLRDGFVDYPEKYFTLYLTGSLTTYQYSDASDCDISIFPDWEALTQATGEEDPEQLRRMLILVVTTELDGTDLPGTPHPLQNFVQKVGVRPEDIFKPGLRSAWDFQSKSWIVPPEKERARDLMTDFPEMVQKAQAIGEKMTILLDHGDVDAARNLYKEVHEKRGKDPSDYSEGNIEYKWLAHKGLFDRLREEAGMHIAKTAKGSEDTEPEGKEVGFLGEPHKDLYPPLFQGMKLRPEAAETLKKHALDAIAEEFDNPDEFCYFTIYGSGISYNWDEKGDIDIQIWVDIDDYNGEPMTQDDLVAAVRRLIASVNFASVKELGLDTQGETGAMLVQYYAKPGSGSKEENLASKPYACYDLEKMQWLVRPTPIKPTFYGDAFLKMLPEANDVANEVESLCDDFERHSLEWEFWNKLNEENPDPKYKTRMDQLQEKAEQTQEGVTRVFKRVFKGRADAYSEGGEGINDQRDILQKYLEIWGLFQRLKRDARKELPWRTGAAKDDDSDKMKVIYDFDNDSIMLGSTTAKDKPERDGIIIGEYDGNSVKLFDVAKQWVNANYFKRLWVNSFPTRPIDKVFFDKTEIPTRPTNQMTYLHKLPHLTSKDRYHDGSKWKHYLKERDIIVDFKLGGDTVLEGKIIDYNDSSIKIKLEDGETRTFDNDFMKQIEFKIRDDKTYLSKVFKHAVALDTSGRYWQSEDLPESGAFGFVDGHLMLSDSHHKAIMGNLINAGWTWEQLMNAEQCWGWFTVENNGWYADSDDDYYLSLNFVSDSGFLNKKAIDEAKDAFVKLYRLPVDDAAVSGGVSEEEYGTGLSGTKAEEGYGADLFAGDVPKPPLPKGISPDQQQLFSRWVEADA